MKNTETRKPKQLLILMLVSLIQYTSAAAFAEISKAVETAKRWEGAFQKIELPLESSTPRPPKSDVDLAIEHIHPELIAFRWIIQEQIARNGTGVRDKIGSKRILLKFEIDQDGKASNIVIEKGSGDSELDNQCVRCVHDSGSYPTLWWHRPTLQVQLTFSSDLWDRKIQNPNGGTLSCVAGTTDAASLLYIEELNTCLSRCWEGKKHPEERRICIRFEISKEGVFSNQELVESKGLTSFDDAALQCIKDVGSLSPLPPGRSEEKPTVIMAYLMPNGTVRAVYKNF